MASPLRLKPCFTVRTQASVAILVNEQSRTHSRTILAQIVNLVKVCAGIQVDGRAARPRRARAPVCGAAFADALRHHKAAVHGQT